ncbi:MAG TPA: hypothetical protein VF272_01510 [Candidatus Saccharimonadia bacterium]
MSDKATAATMIAAGLIASAYRQTESGSVPYTRPNGSPGKFCWNLHSHDGSEPEYWLDENPRHLVGSDPQANQRIRNDGEVLAIHHALNNSGAYR